jgi:tetratricopeptide (TPR) repeat protein
LLEEETLDDLGLKAAALARAGAGEELGRVLKKIRDAAREDTNDLWFCAEALLAAEHPREALDLLKEEAAVPCFELMGAQLRFKEAFALAEPEEDHQRRWLALSRAHARYELGGRDEALAALDKLAGEGDFDLLSRIVDLEVEFGQKDRAWRHAARALSIAEEMDDLSWLLGHLFPGRGAQAAAWAEFFKDKADAEPLSRVRELFEGKLDLPSLAREATAGPRPRRLKWRRMEAVAETLSAAGHRNEALEQFEKLAELSGEPQPLRRMGDLLGELDRWKEAAERYGQAWEKDRSRPGPLYLRGRALVRSGEESKGRELMELARMVPLADESRRQELVEILRGLGQEGEAGRELEIIRRTGDPGTAPYDAAIREAARRAEKKKDFKGAAALLRTSLLRVLSRDVAYPEPASYLMVPFQIRSLAARGLAEAGDLDGALREARAALALLPGDIDLAIDLVPRLEKAGRRKEADELFERALSLRRGILEDHPDASAHHNSLAWLAARTGRELDLALKHAGRAVELEPSEPMYLDTLAEVHFARGDRDRAVELIQKCIDLAPQEPYYREQLSRFRK